jgi:hypothetical protein
VVHGEVCSLDGAVYATGEALCIEITPAQMAAGKKL